MNTSSKISIVLLRVALGFLFLSSGISKIVGQDWTASSYLEKAKTFSGLYQWLASPVNIGWVDFLNEWGMVLIGLALILGAATKLASFFAIFLMLLYYLPILQFPYADKSLIVDQHVIFALAFALLIAFDAGKILGLDGVFKKSLIHNKII